LGTGFVVLELHINRLAAVSLLPIRPRFRS
jgi:hypothetical protein